MRAFGNGNPDVCVNNLLRTFRGEVPYERVKGLDARQIDTVADAADLQIKQDAEWLISTYEPRAELKSLAISGTDENGIGIVQAEITMKE